MHVSNLTAYAGAQAAHPAAPSTAHSAMQAKQTGAVQDPYAGVMGKYDLQNITPLEIDQLADGLTDSGYPFTTELMILRTQGAEFQAHAGKFADRNFDPAEPVNLIQSTKDKLTQARQYGGPTEFLERLLGFLNKYDESAASSGATARRDSVYENIMRHVVQDGAA